MLYSTYSRLIIFALAIIVITAIISVIMFFQGPTLSIEVIASISCWLLLSMIFLFFALYSNVVSFMIAIFCLVTLLSVLAATLNILMILPGTLALLILLLCYAYMAYQNIKQRENISHLPHYLPYFVTVYQWQLAFMRMVVGFAFIPHFAYKLVAGSSLHQQMLASFSQFGFSHSEFFLVLAGSIELAAAISIGFGFLTRLGSILAIIYLFLIIFFTKTLVGGFAWTIPGGGWEYPLFWALLILTFAVFGSGRFSFDHVLQTQYKIPKFIRMLMG